MSWGERRFEDAGTVYVVPPTRPAFKAVEDLRNQLGIINDALVRFETIRQHSTNVTRTPVPREDLDDASILAATAELRAACTRLETWLAAQ